MSLRPSYSALTRVLPVAVACLCAFAGSVGTRPAAAQSAAPEFQSDFCQHAGGAVDWPALKAQVEEPAKAFGLDLYRSLAAQPGNLVFSPASLDAALAMTLAGTAGTTAQELAAALHVGAHGAAWHKLYGGFLAQLTCPARHRASLLTIANALFVQNDKALQPPFQALLRDDYDSPLTEVDFQKHLEAARRTVNGWTERATAGKIRDLLTPGVLTPETRLVLVDAVYLKARWAAPFTPALTAPGAFHTSATASVTTPLMHREGGAYDFEYAALPTFQAVGLPSTDQATLVVLLVPAAAAGLAAVEAQLDAPLIAKVLDELRHRKVTLTLPRFKLTTAVRLKQALTGLGVRRLFDPAAADLTPVDAGRDRLFVGDVIHKAYIDVNEEGLEAAAATASVAKAGAAMPPPSAPVEVKADHPFLYLVVDSSTKSLLFLGRVTDPTASGG